MEPVRHVDAELRPVFLISPDEAAALAEFDATRIDSLETAHDGLELVEPIELAIDLELLR